ncbi:MAG: putative DNA modification/repair radical SAM protein [Anaerolineae bacterium]|nr:putative DNA modification/repair radical SAM protein [Anaerolineae bacterium]MDW8101921.1 putative DNA modification/repair radical SAM protein [Anaerolineae bacterium]
MDTEKKLELLGKAAQYDLCGEACSPNVHRIKDDLGRWLYPAVLPDGKRVILLKVLLSNACVNNCLYCANRAGRDCPRMSFTPEELASIFDHLWRRGTVKGLFLSSAIDGSPDEVMARMIATAEIIRRRYGFHGYIHLKVIPGASRAAVEAMARWATRMSVNLEAPSPETLNRIAPGKNFTENLFAPIAWIKELMEEGKALLPAGQTTQFMVGPGGERDRDLLRLAQSLYRDFGMQRIYYSAFQPVPNTPLEAHPPTPAWREHRLYQADFLIRRYGFTVEELTFNSDGNLPREGDPKLLWALKHPEFFPVEVNTADYHQLLRVPGIGPRSARKIIAERKKGAISFIEDLKKLGVITGRAAPFITLKGKRPAFQIGLL